jgi:hypothetical protein
MYQHVPNVPYLGFSLNEGRRIQTLSLGAQEQIQNSP